MNWLFTRYNPTAWVTILIGLATMNLVHAQAINVTTNISPTTNLCANSTVSLTFSTTGVFTAGNVFSLQQSDENGLFPASPVVVANLASAPTSASTLTISGNLGTVTYGTGYRFRVMSSTPVRTSNQTPSAVTIGTNVPTPGQSGIYTFCPNSGLQPITATGSGVIEWYNGSAANAPVVVTGGTYNVPTVSSPITYYVTQTVNGCKSAKAAVTVSLSAPTSAPDFTPPGAFCPGQGPATLTATPTSTGVAATIQWVSSASTQTGASITTPQTTGTYTYTISQFDSRGCPSASKTVATVTVNAAPSTAPTPNVPAAYCSDNVPGPLSANLSNGATSLKWYNLSDNTTATTSTIPAPTSTKQYQVSQFIGSCEGPRSTAFTVTVNPKPADPTLNSAGPFCQNSGANNTQTITASGQNIEWFTSSSSTSAVATGSSFQISTAGGNVPVYFRQTINGCASNRVTASVTVNATPSAAPTFTPPATYCSNATPGMLTATLTGGATAARWYTVGGGSTDGVSIPAPTTTTQYQVSQFIGSCEGPRSTAFTITVTPKPGNPSPGSIGPFCQNSGSNNVQTITATGTGTIEWFINGSTPNVITTGSSYTVSTASATPQTVYYRQVVNGCPSDRLPITVTINPIPAAPTSVQSRTYCAGETAATLSATEPGVLWYTTATGGSGSTQAPKPSTDASNVGTPQLFYASQTVANCESQQRQQVSVTVKRTPGLPTNISSPAFCQTYAPSTLSAQPESGATLIWVNNGVESATAPVVPNTAARTYTYQVLQTVNGCRSSAASVTVQVKPTPGQPGITPYSLCLGRDSRALQVSGTELKFYDANDLLLGTTPPSPSTSQITTVVYKVSQSIDGCEGPKITYNVPVYAIPANPIFTQPRDYCAEDAATDLVASGQSLLWYGSATGGAGSGQAPRPSTAATNVGSGQTFYVTQTVNGCESGRQPISITVKRKPALPTTATTVDFCQTYTAPTLTASPESGASIIWVNNGVEGAIAPVPPKDVARSYTYQVLQELNGCRSNQATVTVRVKSTPGQPGITPFDLCQLSPGRALQASGTELKFYDGNNLLGSTAPTVATGTPGTFTYQVSQSTDGCEGPKITYSVVVKPKPAPPATQAVNYCVESASNPDQPKQNVQPLSAQGQSLQWYFVDGNAFPAGFMPTPSVGNTYAMDYRVTQTVNNCVSDQALLRVTVQANPAPVIAASLVTYCRNDAARPLEATGPGLRWFDPNGQLLPASDQNPTPPTANATKGGETYQVYSVSSSGCASPRSTIRLVINTNPTLGLLGSTTVNYGQSASLKLRFTSSPPYTYTLTDGTAGVANDTLSSVSVKPLQTTTYRVASVSNVCGNGLPGNPATATIFVNIPTISTQALATGTVCAGTSFAVTYTTAGSFNAGNGFKVQIADTTSKNYVDVSAVSTGSTITANLSTSLTGGVYFVRVLATNPGAEVPGLRSPTVLTVRGLPGALLTGTQNVYEGSPASLSIALTGDGPWSISYGFTTEGASQTATSTFQTNANPHILSVQPPKTASYFLTAISNNCGTGPVSGTAVVTVLPLLAVENPLLNTVLLYPVPTQTLLTVAIDLPLTAQEPAHLTLRDGAGIPVLNRQTDARQTVLDLSQQPAGLYLMTVQVGEHRLVRKIMKL